VPGPEYNGAVDDPTAGSEHPRTGPSPGDPAHGDPAQDPAPQDDPGARAKADVRAILAKALGLRRLVELAAEFGGAPDPARPELPRARYRRPGRRPGR
jgi:hypothetical protein